MGDDFPDGNRPSGKVEPAGDGTKGAVMSMPVSVLGYGGLELLLGRRQRKAADIEPVYHLRDRASVEIGLATGPVLRVLGIIFFAAPFHPCPVITGAGRALRGYLNSVGITEERYNVTTDVTFPTPQLHIPNV